jgi:nucleoporin NUP159
VLETAIEAPPVPSPSKFTPSPFTERAKAALGESPFKALSKETPEEEEFEEQTGEESEEDSEGSESFVEVSVPASPVLPASTSEEGRLEDLSLSDQAQSTKREIPEIEEATEGLQQVKLESKPAEFLVYAGFTKPSERPSSNEIINQTISIIETTEGNLQIAGENGKLLSQFIDDQEDNMVSLESLELAQARVPLVERTQELKATLLQLNNLSADIQKSYGEKIKVDKLYSQLALIAENKVENTPVLKGRPLDIKDDFMRTQLRKKVAQVNSDMQKLLTMLMPWKAKNSMNPHTIDNIERIVFQINEQILDRTEDVDKLVSQLDKLEIYHKKDVKVTSNSSKLKLRKKLKQTTSIMY